MKIENIWIWIACFWNLPVKEFCYLRTLLTDSRHVICWLSVVTTMVSPKAGTYVHHGGDWRVQEVAAEG